MEKITAYQCSHCRKKIYINKKSCQNHERKCFFNPINRSCASCANLQIELVNALIPEHPNAMADKLVCLKNVEISNHALKNECNQYKEGTGLRKQD